MRPLKLLRIAFLVGLPLLCVGCKSNNEGRIEGTYWVSQTVKFQGHVMPAGFLKLWFYKDGAMTYQAGKQEFNGKYTLGMGDTVIFNLNRELAGRKTHHQKCVIVDDRLTVTDSDGTKAHFSKKPK